jgi:acyl-CoA oxidase
LQNRFSIPLPDPQQSLLARHASSLLEENRRLFKSFSSNHRSEMFNSLILPQAQLAVEAIGHALAYSNGLKAGLPQPILDVYECAVIRQDPAWYSEQAGITRIDQRLREDVAISSMLPDLPTYLSELHIENYVTAPIVSDDAWKAYLKELPVYTGSTPGRLPQFQAHL